MIALDEGLSLSTSVHDALSSALNGDGELDPDDLLNNLKTFKKLFVDARREHACALARSMVEHDALKQEIHCDLVDRDANAARIAERQRFLFERQTALPGQASAAERAAQSAAYVEAALVALCPYVAPPLPGCEQLAAAERATRQSDDCC